VSETLPSPKRRPRARRKLALKKLELAAANALEVMRFGRLGPKVGAPYAIVHEGAHYRLRRYGDGAHDGPALLLVPPLMVTAEIYDVAPDLSAVSALAAGGVVPFVIDFGAPEREEGGMHRTLDDHVRAVADAVGRVRAATGRDVHLAGYSQGGMFAYQAAAYLGSLGLASVITFGSPVDIHQSLPNVSSEVAERMIELVRPVVEPTLRRIEGLPGVLTSTGFKLLSFRKEIGQLVDFVRKLHDRQALVKREARRRFLGGEGFVAWPGPALRTFVEDFIVHNRMMSGGFVIDGRTVTLADLRSPVLCFVGLRDEMARPRAVRAIVRAAPSATVFEVALHAGHFGLVVGGTANRLTWPTVLEWIRWREGTGPRPVLLPERVEPRAPLTEGDQEEAENVAIVDALDIELFYDVAKEALHNAWNRLGEVVVDVGEAADALRYQLPRLHRLRGLEEHDLVSAGRALAEQARKIPERTFFLFRGRAFTYDEANQRVDRVVRGLLACGVRPGDSVGVLMDGRPSFLSMVTACSRLGAVSVLMSPRLDDDDLVRALALTTPRFLAADPDHAVRARAAFTGHVLVLGGGAGRKLEADVVDMEAIDPEAVSVPAWYVPNPGRAGDPAMVLVTKGEGGLRAAHVSNRRWALSAYGAAAACTLTSGDTVYCCMPLHHAAGLLVSVGGALVGGARLALAAQALRGATLAAGPTIDPPVFWSEVHTYGATVVFYAGEMARELLRARPSPAERGSPLRLFAGSGMRADAWRRLRERTGASVLEFYASTEGALVLANAAGEKVGALGRPLPGSSEVALLEWDFATGSIVRDSRGRGVAAPPGEPGIFAARMPAPSTASRRALALSVFAPGDAWLTTGDLARRDADGDYWFVDRVADVIHTASGPLASRALEDTLYELDAVALAVAYGVEEDGTELPAAAVVLRAGAALDADALTSVLSARHPRDVWPRIVRLVPSIPMTEGFRPLKNALRNGRLRDFTGPFLELKDRGGYDRFGLDG
jgi:putative long chain acyl-CoA synthase